MTTDTIMFILFFAVPFGAFVTYACFNQLEWPIDEEDEE